MVIKSLVSSLVFFSFILVSACTNLSPQFPADGASPPATTPSVHSRPDPKTFAEFEAAGIAPPDTVMTSRGREPGTMDMEQIREAIAEAKILSEDQQRKLEQQLVEEKAQNEERHDEMPQDSQHARLSAAPQKNLVTEEFAAQPMAKKAEAIAPMENTARRALSGKGAINKEVQPGSNAKDDSSSGPKPLLKQVATSSREAKILVRNEEGKLVPLVTRELRIVTYIQGPRARTLVDTVFENKTDHTLQGTFYFPLPADASPVGFAMFRGAPPADSSKLFEHGSSLPKLSDNTQVPEQLQANAPSKSSSAMGVDWEKPQEARVVENKRAREVYEEVVRNDIDPALLEWSGGNNFQARVFPIQPKALKRVVLVYEQTLPFDGEYSRYIFTLPDKKMPIAAAARVHVDESLGTVVAATMSRDLRAIKPKGRKLGIWTTFDLQQEGKGGALTVAIKPKNPKAQVISSTDTDGLQGRLFFASLSPEMPKNAMNSTGRALFVVDTSMSGEDNRAHELQGAMLRALIENDDSIDQYAVVLFDIRPRWLHGPSWIENTDKNRKATMRQLRKVYLEGATNFDAMLSDLDNQLTWLTQGGQQPSAFLLSDGQITWGLSAVDALVKKHQSAAGLRWVSYRFGENAANQALFDALSRESNGRTVTVMSQAEIPDAVTAHRRSAAVLKSVTILGNTATDMVIAGNPKLLFSGQRIQVAGRILQPGQAKLIMKADMNGTEISMRVPIPNDTHHYMAPRAFGELFTRRLLSLDDERLDRMIVALSQHYLLANERASLLILEDEDSYKSFDISRENVDLTNLEQLRRSESDKRRLKLQALDLDDAGQLAIDVVRGLEKLDGKLTPPLKAQPLVDAPTSGGKERIAAELAYRKARKKQRLDVMIYDAVARARAVAGDTMGAIRALSCTVELRPMDAEAARMVGYGLLALGQYEPAAELFERSRLRRPFEGQAFLEEALALDGAGRLGAAARRYEIVLSRSWKRHDIEVKTVAAFHFARLLSSIMHMGSALPAPLKTKIKKRLEELQETTGRDKIDYQLTTHWSTDSIDIDLWVYEPDHSKCFYNNMNTPLGGHLFWDITDGLGPELYQMKKATHGQYVVAVHFYGNNSPRLAVPTSLLLVMDKDVFGPEDRYTRRFQMRMLPKKDAVLELRTEQL